MGKTTIARILAKCLNCETGVTATPCEVCPTCKAVNEGRFIDLIEIDAASRTKVEDTRELLDNVPYAPTQGRFKVYLIDEVHMLSTHSFNALLKTLEEPPEHVKFLFATTDPHKLPITVISRCLQFTLRPLAIDEITQHLNQVLSTESIVADSDAIWQIAESAQGSLRDALSLTDQAIAYGQGEIHHQDIKEMLGLIDRTIIYDLILSIHQNQPARVSALLLQFRQQALDVSLVLDQLISTLHELALLQYLPDLALKYSHEVNQKIMQLSSLISAADLQLYYQIACKGRAELQLAVTQEQGFEMCVLRLLAFRPISVNELPDQASQPSLATHSQPLVEMLQPTSDDVFEMENTTAASVVENAPSPVAMVAQPSSVFTPSEENENHQNLCKVSDDHSLKHNDDIQLQQCQDQQAQSESIVFDATSDELLFGLDIASSEVTDIQQHCDNDVVLEDFSVESSISESHQLVSKQTMAIDCNTEQSVMESLWEETAVDSDRDIAIPQDESPLITVASSCMPQDILRLSEQDLHGEWTVEKWEYWFRYAELSPAVQELAQHGIMTGNINGESIFHIPEQYQALLDQLQVYLEQALQQQWPQTVFGVKYENLTCTTPYTLLNQRKQKAFQRASELLHHDSVVQSLIHNFDAELHNIQLK